MVGVELYDAVHNNDLDQLKQLIRQHKLDVNAWFQEVRRDNQSWQFSCPLHLAAFDGHHAMLQYLLDSGGDVNVRTAKFRRTPLHFSVLHQQMACTLLLIHSGATLDASDIFGNTACHYSAEDGTCSIVDLLVREGADVNAVEVTRKTPLMKAARNNRTEVVLRLLEAGADVNLIDSNGDTALHFAARNGLTGVLDVLLGSGCLMDVQNSWGSTPLMEAVSNNHMTTLQHLVHAGCDLNCQELKTGDTALHAAVRKSNADLVRVLLEAGARHDVYNHEGETPLFEAVVVNKTSLLPLMVEFNCRLDVPLKRIPFVVCKSAFELAAERGHLDTCCMLAELGHMDYSCRDVLYSRYLPPRPVPRDAPLAWLQDAMQHVPTLRQLCRKVIRNSCDHLLSLKVQALPVPPGLRDYILVKEGLCLP
ncbi:uncharacterized protein LOC143294396 [Babylonia areolata]|uniref:uncharacterized protein LOC143294396 n=1 Tax=Babylonia areolata TaxID=304850 RepID=UPI003FD0C3CB